MSTIPIPAQEQISAFLNSRIAAGDFPSAVYLVAERARPVFGDALGHAVVDPYRITASLETIYDLASLTKPLVTGLLCARRIDEGELTLDSAVAHYLPEFERTDRQMITVRQLLTHTSGLPAWRPLYILAEGERDRVLGVIAAEDLDYQPGKRVVYSDLGFITLGFLLERYTGKQMADLARLEIFQALRLKSTFFNPEVAMQTGIAACETGNAYERATSEEMGTPEYANWRENLIWGEVHDGNAHFLGGAAGHAGLFSTAIETARIAAQFLATQSEILSARTCELFRTNMTEGLEEARSLAWQLAATPESAAGPALPPDSYGHSGFTGTSCWIDPHRERVFVLLTNRTHARSLPFVNINSVRREFHSLAVAALETGTV
ncbi:MAG: beta-lactamase family protein [Pyrinomonadaceae bacterium]|nr:beta-lactamase family protein [Pyrinomonadaceae bacterium]